ncbi:MAG TPA: methyltransferase [Candidatus Dormibacteraeota bacterium]|nr:methyltransferase [Candidatus Dormibacteraeota bacterium]
MSIPKKRQPLAPGEEAVPSSTRRGHYFDPQPESESRPHLVKLRLGADRKLELQADRGVFGSRRVDLGTEVLLKEAPPPPDRGEVLDLGAGYGPIAVALAQLSPGARFWAVDINQRAVELTRLNAAAAGLGNVVAAVPDDVPADLHFAAIYSNPPVRVGKQALHELLDRWLARLVAGGLAYLVVQRNLGADSLATWLAENGYPVRRLKAKKGYRILEVGRRDEEGSASS